MRRSHFGKAACTAGLLLAGCKSGGLTPDQKAQANQEWNAARAGVLASLAADQFRDGMLDKCQETLDKALRLQPDNAGLHLLAAKLAIEQGKPEIADAHLHQTVKLDPANAEADYLSGILLQRWQQPEPARLAYARAAAKAPSELGYVLAQAEMLVAQDRATEAIALLRGAVPAFEHRSEIRDAIGQLLVGQKQYDEAARLFREAGRLAPEDAAVREHLAFALLAARQYPEAVDVFDRLSTQVTYDKRADIQAALGECRFQTRRYAEAQLGYEAATRLNPACAGYWRGLAKVSAQRGDLPAADIAVRKALSIDPVSIDGQCLLGYVRLKQNQLPQSLAAFRVAADLDPRDSVNIGLQGYVLARMGRQAEAQVCFARALAIDPKDPLATRFTQHADVRD